MSKIPEPARPAPRRRNTFEQAAQTLPTDAASATQPEASSAATVIAATPQPATVASATQEPTPRIAMQTPVAQQVAVGEKKRKQGTLDILLSVPEDLKQRMVATLEHTRPRTGITSQQQFIRTAIEQLCKRLEQELNDGDQFPAPANQITL